VLRTISRGAAELRTDRSLVWNQSHLRRILREYETHHNQHRSHRSLGGAAPLKSLPEPVDLEQHRVRRQTRIGGLINEYRLAARPGRGFRHPRAEQGKWLLPYYVRISTNWEVR
jgi:hypothetical protein